VKLSYSDYNTYKLCPSRYSMEINKVEPPEKQSCYFAVYGILVEMFFNVYTNGYTKRGVHLPEGQIHSLLRKLWTKVLDENFVEWVDPWVRESSEHIFMSAYEDIIKNINTFDLWDHTQSEVSFEILLKKSQDILSCKLDFLVNRPDGTVEILDGKGTYKMDKPVDLDQLYFYILIYLLHFKKLPDKAGFLYYKFQTIRYIDFDMGTIMDFKNKLTLVKRTIKEDKKFEAKVGISKQCKWCPYNMTCEALINKRKERADKKKPVTPFVFDGEILSFSMKGICDEGSD